MDIKHQIFVSSTYKDLIEERKEVIHALLELDCIPSGMELFPATDEDAWSLITEVIDGCDYYILILAGKYGSTNSDGIGYTEMEFDYAVSQGKPVICFIHQNPEELPAGKVEPTDKGKENLKTFRSKAQEKHCKFWSTPHDLGAKVSRSLIQLKKKHPSEGWVRGRYAADQKMLSEIEEMRRRIAELELENLSNKNLPPSNFEKLKNGKDTYRVVRDLKIDSKGNIKDIDLEPTWDTLFSYCGAALYGECTSEELKQKTQLAYWHSVPKEYVKFNKFTDIIIPMVCLDQIRIQFQALGLMDAGTKKRAVSDTNAYWKLTPFGEKYLIQIKALKKEGSDSKLLGALLGVSSVDSHQEVNILG